MQLIYEINLSFLAFLCNFNKLIEIHKNSDLKTKQGKVVYYRIDCKNCNASYVGQTSRHLKIRISEY